MLTNGLTLTQARREERANRGRRWPESADARRWGSVVYIEDIHSYSIIGDCTEFRRWSDTILASEQICIALGSGCMMQRSGMNQKIKYRGITRYQDSDPVPALVGRLNSLSSAFHLLWYNETDFGHENHEVSAPACAPLLFFGFAFMDIDAASAACDLIDKKLSAACDDRARREAQWRDRSALFLGLLDEACLFLCDATEGGTQDAILERVNQTVNRAILLGYRGLDFDFLPPFAHSDESPLLRGLKKEPNVFCAHKLHLLRGNTSPNMSNASKALVTSGLPSSSKAPYRRASNLPPSRKYPESPFQTLPSRLRDSLKISQVPKSSRRFLLFPTIYPLSSLLSALIPPYPPPPPPLLPSTPGPYPTDYLCGLTADSIERAVFRCTPRYLNTVAHLSISNIRTLLLSDVFDNHIVQFILLNYVVIVTSSMHNFFFLIFVSVFGFGRSSRRADRVAHRNKKIIAVLKKYFATKAPPGETSASIHTTIPVFNLHPDPPHPNDEPRLPDAWKTTPRPHPLSSPLARFEDDVTLPSSPSPLVHAIYHARCEITGDSENQALTLVHSNNTLVFPSNENDHDRPFLTYYLLDEPCDRTFGLIAHHVPIALESLTPHCLADDSRKLMFVADNARVKSYSWASATGAIYESPLATHTLSTPEHHGPLAMLAGGRFMRTGKGSVGLWNLDELATHGVQGISRIGGLLKGKYECPNAHLIPRTSHNVKLYFAPNKLF
ncbi:hypothetical protein B0H11DRAFT_1916390 [Mycena galericulata]|nr:hypothetical protein B0H11DRAFT_1916390 [Mycena galericulata]